jgi:hypothetical protein
MGPDRTTGAEKLLTWLGLWGAMRSASALLAALVAGVGLLELLAPSAARLFPGVPGNILQVSAVGLGLLAGLIGHFTAEAWDRVVFDALYGPRGRWLERSRPPLGIFPEGQPLQRSRGLLVQALPRKPDSGPAIDREAVKLARRQVERWERIERPLVLATFVRGFLSPAVFAAVLAAGGGVAAWLAGPRTQAPRLLMVAAACLAVAVALLVPYTRLRVEYLLRLYEDVAGHARHKKPERRSELSRPGGAP